MSHGWVLMVRIAVAMYLMVAQVAGSFVCCCTVSRLAPSHARPAPDRPACCCHKPRGKEQRQVPPRPQPVRPGCPCRQQVGDNATVLLGSEGRQLQERPPAQGPAPLLSFLALDFRRSVAAASLLLREGHTLPFLTTADLLDRLPVLQC